MKIGGYIRKTAVLCAAVLLLGGCGSQEKYEFRDEAIRQMEEGSYAEAVQTFHKALDSSDGTVGEFELDVLRYRAEAEYMAGDYEASAATYDVLWQTDGRKPEYLTRNCAMLLLAGRLDEAKERYLQIYEDQKDSEDTVALLISLGAALREDGRISEASELFQQAADDGIQNGEIYNQLALAQMDAGEYDQALALIEKGLAAGGDARERLLYNQAAAYEKKLDFADALRSLETYVREFGATDEVEKEIAFLLTRVE